MANRSLKRVVPVRFIVVVQLFASIVSLMAEEGGRESAPRDRFSITIRSAYTEYIPHDWNLLPFGTVNGQLYDRELRSNVIQNLNVSFGVLSESGRYGLVLSHYELRQDDAYSYDWIYRPGSGFAFYRNIVYTAPREESRVAGYQYLNYNDHTIGFGAGLRHIKISRSSSSSNGFFYSRISGAGPQAGISYDYRISERFAFHSSLDGYIVYAHTAAESAYVGDTVYFPQNGPPFILPFEIHSSEGRSMFNGMEVNLALSYAFHRNFSFLLGYDFNLARYTIKEKRETGIQSPDSMLYDIVYNEVFLKNSPMGELQAASLRPSRSEHNGVLRA